MDQQGFDSLADVESVRYLLDLGYEDPKDVAARAHEAQAQLDDARRQVEQLLSSGQFDAAIDALASLERAAPNWHAPHWLSAHAFYASSRFTEARSHLDWLRFHGVESAGIAMLRSRVELAQRKRLAALDQAQYARALDPNMSGIDALIGEILRQQGAIEEAVAAFDRALRRDASNPGALSGLAAIAISRHDFASAVDHCLTAVSQQFQLPLVHMRLGIALAGLGEFAGAMTAFETAIKLQPNLIAVYRCAATVAERPLRDPDLARQFRQRGSDRIRQKRNERRARITQSRDS